MGLLLSIFFGIVPMLFYATIAWWFDRYEKEPVPLILGVFTWGAIVAAGAAFVINTVFGVGAYLVFGESLISDLFIGSGVAPFVEEIVKGFAVLGVFLLFRREFDSILDGITYAAIVAYGFAATENIYYIYSYGFLEGGYAGLAWLVFIRVLLVGFQHAFYTAFTGIGFAVSRLSKNVGVKLIAPLLGLSAAMFTHAVHNGLASLMGGLGLAGLALGSLLDWAGVLAMFGFTVWAVRREQRWIIEHLCDEVDQGTLLDGQYRRACSSLAATAARWSALGGGWNKWRATHRFYQLCAELAHKKHQYATMGEESGNRAAIENLRGELRRLSPMVG